MRIASAVCLVLLLACNKKTEELTSDFKPTEAAPLPPGPEKLEKTDEVVGTGPEAKSGDKVSMKYRGTLMNGTEFDSTAKHGDEPFSFTIGKGEVIKGWDEGVPGMKVGGKRKLVIPSALGYGDNGSPPNIPGKAGLKFDVELVGIEGKEATPAPSASAAAKKK